MWDSGGWSALLRPQASLWCRERETPWGWLQGISPQFFDHLPQPKCNPNPLYIRWKVSQWKSERLNLILPHLRETSWKGYSCSFPSALASLQRTPRLPSSSARGSWWSQGPHRGGWLWRRRGSGSSCWSAPQWRGCLRAADSASAA